MEEMNHKSNTKNIIILFAVILVVVIVTSIITSKLLLKDNNKGPTSTVTPTITPTIEPTIIPTPTASIPSDIDFTMDIIKQVNKDNTSNYLISPYSIEIALNMLREGADGNTKTEIDNVIGNRKINNISIPGIVNVVNGLFVSNKNKSKVKSDFVNSIKTKYQSEVLYDDFNTPDVINNWVNEKTDGMIPKILDNISPDFILGVANALTMDAKWQSEFECVNTRGGKFTKIDNSIISVEMMSKAYKSTAKYIENDKAKGVILPYRTDSKNVQLEFVGILPNSSVSDYVNKLTRNELNGLLNSEKEASSKYHILLNLPRFTYDYEIKDFNKVLSRMGIHDAFDSLKANLSRMIDADAVVSDAIHKTYIELNEKGTKASALTFFGADGTGIMKDYEEVSISFDKPFVYMIRERNTGEILFFGTVYEPNIWNGSTCSNTNKK